MLLVGMVNSINFFMTAKKGILKKKHFDDSILSLP